MVLNYSDQGNVEDGTGYRGQMFFSHNVINVHKLLLHLLAIGPLSTYVYCSCYHYSFYYYSYFFSNDSLFIILKVFRPHTNDVQIGDFMHAFIFFIFLEFVPSFYNIVILGHAIVDNSQALHCTADYMHFCCVSPENSWVHVHSVSDGAFRAI